MLPSSVHSSAKISPLLRTTGQSISHRVTSRILRALQEKFSAKESPYTVSFREMASSTLNALHTVKAYGYYSLEISEEQKSDIEQILNRDFSVEAFSLLGVGSHTLAYKITLGIREYVVKVHQPGRCLLRGDSTINGSIDSRESFPNQMQRVLQAAKELNPELEKNKIRIVKPIYASRSIMIVPYEPGIPVGLFHIHDIPIIREASSVVKKYVVKNHLHPWNWFGQTKKERIKYLDAKRRLDEQRASLTVSYRIFLAEQTFLGYNPNRNGLPHAQYDRGYSNYFITNDGVLLLIDPFSLNCNGDIAHNESHKQEDTTSEG